MKSKPSEMSLVSGGMSAEEMNEIFGSRCVCSSNSADWNVIRPGDNCQCDYGTENALANYYIAHDDNPGG